MNQLGTYIYPHIPSLGLIFRIHKSDYVTCFFPFGVFPSLWRSRTKALVQRKGSVRLGPCLPQQQHLPSLSAQRSFLPKSLCKCSFLCQGLSSSYLTRPDSSRASLKQSVLKKAFRGPQSRSDHPFPTFLPLHSFLHTFITTIIKYAIICLIYVSQAERKGQEGQSSPRCA